VDAGRAGNEPLVDDEILYIRLLAHRPRPALCREIRLRRLSIHARGLLAVAIAVGFRYPAAWALVLITKVTPGIGLVWFAVRREWCPLATRRAGQPGHRLTTVGLPFAR